MAAGRCSTAVALAVAALLVVGTSLGACWGESFEPETFTIVPPEQMEPDVAEPCPPPMERCDGVCVDQANDIGHCGSCENACEPEETCEDGVCTPPADVCYELKLTSDAPTPALLVGQTAQLTATCRIGPGLYADVTADAIFTSSDTEVMTVTEDGVVKGLWVGPATVTATFEDDASGQVESDSLVFVFEGQEPEW